MVLNVRRCLVIPDVHQNVAWVERVLARETECDLAVFLGDYFDIRTPLKIRTGVGATCAYLMKTWQERGRKSVFLLGNHDVQYLEAKPACDQYCTPRNLHYKCGSAYTHAAAAEVAKGLSEEFWSGTRLFVSVNGWLLSHAGVAQTLWPPQASTADSLAALEDQAARALTTMRKGAHPLLQAGAVRGGDATVGGITWQDWDHEFSDALPCPQIVGHTASELGARKKGRSWCVDGNQTCYGVLTGENLTVKAC
ncbi:MAG: metallophosphoesterase [Undibacterium sp.]|nr:metallophosphoesterase [Opitutaceae bacterium]